MATEKRGPGRPRVKSQVEEEAQTQLEDSTTEEII